MILILVGFFFFLVWGVLGLSFIAGKSIWEDKSFYPYGLIIRFLCGPIYWLLASAYWIATVSDDLCIQLEEKRLQKEGVNRVTKIKSDRLKVDNKIK